MLLSLCKVYTDQENKLIFTETKQHHLDAEKYLSTMTLFENGITIQQGSA